MDLDWLKKATNETLHCEFKLAQGGVPKSLYETLSAFANTDGGDVYLGVEQNPSGNVLCGVKNPQSYITDIINTVMNSQKVSFPVLNEGSFELCELGDGKSLIRIHVNEAPRTRKPVYLDNDITHSFGRNFEGDYRLLPPQLKAMIADNQEDHYDLLPNMMGYGFESVDLETLSRYREEMNAIYPQNRLRGLTDEDFMRASGMLRKNDHGEEVLTVAATLLFTTFEKIVTLFPSYMLDYQRSETISSKWDYRIASDEPTWSGNLFDFYYYAFADASRHLPARYVAQNGKNVGEALMVDALKESFANALSNHAFYLPVPLKAVREADGFRIRNGGRMLLPLQSAIVGGVSIPRNVGIITALRRIGVADRTGSGIPNLFTAMRQNGYVDPVFEESCDPYDSTVLSLRFVSAEGTSDSRAYSVLKQRGKEGISVGELQYLLGVSRTYASNALNELLRAGLATDNGAKTKGRRFYYVDPMD